MLSLPHEKAFNVFRPSVGSVGNEYDRLVALTGVGKSCGVAWGQRGMLVEMKSIADNARWWAQLKLLGKLKKRRGKMGCKSGKNEGKMKENGLELLKLI